MSVSRQVNFLERIKLVLEPVRMRFESSYIHADFSVLFFLLSSTLAEYLEDDFLMGCWCSRACILFVEIHSDVGRRPGHDARTFTFSGKTLISQTH